ncbi:DUF6518 family protein, partial [Micromonospora sp. MA102]|uniref:DUF6518 family protein n=1 Tax=Micromonospora sp. MA102 TaxID=2952755 RepID=UPI0021C67F3A
IPTGLDRQPGRTLTQLIVVLLRCGHRRCSSQVSMSPSNPVRNTVWLAGSLLAGPLLGLLGHAVRANTTRRAAVAAGIACGLLSAEGWHAIVQAPPWRLLALDDPFFYGVAFGEIVRVVLPLAVLAWLIAAHRLGRAWPTLLAATAAAATAGTLLWYALGLVQGA